ncbi:MAG: ABC-type polysaccharide/polyol phosphate transport system, ATPase component, partial [Verrucomicrobiales bacterium]|nr:ABC-type polysaccharide/polyol phosphate transport system, ATPase component [Verrucomicrobiales bacterium]
DEVLAVGDVEFQKKCLGKMQDVSTKEGRTVLFVSHNMEAMRSLCTNAILLWRGQVAENGNPEKIIASYLCQEAPAEGLINFKPNQNSPLNFLSLCVTQAGKTITGIDPCQPFDIELSYEVFAKVENLEVGLRISNARGVPITTAHTKIGPENGKNASMDLGKYNARVSIPPLFLMPDTYTLTAAAFQYNRTIFDQRDNVLQFRVLEIGTNVAKYGRSAEIGVVLNRFPWTHSRMCAG